MRHESWGKLDVVVTGGSDREGAGDGPVVVLCHGFGAPGEDLVPLWRVLDVPPEVRFVFPAAPLRLEMGWGDSRAWWLIDMARLERAMRSSETRESLSSLARDKPAGLDEARALFHDTLDAVEKNLGVDGSRVVIGGFSQGAMLACDLALREERKLAGLALMSGTLLCEDEWTAKMPSRQSLPVFQSHGTHDPLLPFSIAERLRDQLRAAGLAVDWVPFRGQHAIPPEVLDGLSAFLTRVFQ